MKFKNLKAQNFQSLGDVTFPFPSGLVLIDGIDLDLQSSNGVGKSALMSSITYALYGRTPKDIKLESLKRDGMASMSVELEFEANNGTLITVKRIRTDTSSKLILTINSEKIDGTIKDLEKRIPELVGLSFEQFVQSVYIFQGSNKRFISLNDSDKKKFLSTILNLDSYDAAYKLAHTNLTANELDTSRISGSTESTKQNLELLNKQLESATEALSIFQTQKESQKKDLTFQANALQKDITLLETKIQELSKESNLAIQQLQSEKMVIDQKIQKGRNIEDSIRKVRREIENVESDIQKLTSLKDNGQSVCQTCGQELPDFNLQTHILECDAKLVPLVSRQKSLTVLLGTYEVPNYDSLNSELMLIMEKIGQEKSKGPEKLQMEVSLKRSELRNISNTLSSADEKGMVLQGQISNLKDSISTSKNNLEKLQLQHMDLAEQKTYLSEAKKIFSPTGVKAYVFDALIRELNTRIEYFLDVLTGGIMKFNFTSDEIKGKFSEQCEYSGLNRDIGSLSGGEYKRLSLAVDLALADVVSGRSSIAPNVLFLDEAADGLDVSGKESLMHLMSLLTDKKDAIYIVDHSSEFKSSFNQVFRLVKRNQETNVE